MGVPLKEQYIAALWVPGGIARHLERRILESPSTKVGGHGRQLL